MSEIRFYKYYFIGLENPIIMEAESKTVADQMLSQLSVKSGVNINLERLIDMKIESPLLGVSIRKRRGQEFVWVGRDKTSDGWMLKEEYEYLNNIKKQ